MRILGIDPGSRATGFGVIDSDGRHSRHVFSGCIRTTSKDFSRRLGEIYSGINLVLEEHAPEQVVVEQVFMAANPSSALKLGHARGAAITAAVMAELPVFEYTPRAVKLALVGTGAAEKEQVQHMIRLLLGVRQRMTLDESDALAVALCHAHHSSTSIKLRGRR
ncbi:crossover junction endodeoxyribonuclease RuvC [Thiolapillus sp.]